MTSSLFHWETPLVVLSRGKGDRINHIVAIFPSVAY